MSTTVIWVIVAIVVVGVLWYVMKRKKSGQGGQPMPPSNQPPQM